MAVGDMPAGPLDTAHLPEPMRLAMARRYRALRERSQSIGRHGGELVWSVSPAMVRAYVLARHVTGDAYAEVRRTVFGASAIGDGGERWIRAIVGRLTALDRALDAEGGAA